MIGIWGNPVPGMIRAIDETLPHTARQQCLSHNARNRQSKVPEDSLG
jgi:transposase-like protein